MKLVRLEKILVNISARARNIKVVERLLTQIDLSNVREVLEVGCGVGTLSSHLARKYKWNVTGIDLDPEQIERARKDRVGNECLKFFEADVTQLPFEDREFDMVLSFDVLHHIPNWDKALEEVSRVLKPNGFYVLSDLTFPKSMGRAFGDYFNFASLQPEDIVNEMRANNLEIAYEERPKINIFGNRFSIVSKRVQATIARSYTFEEGRREHREKKYRRID